jgi:iron-sulfur cluster repair protein YtfE (RIC family)
MAMTIDGREAIRSFVEHEHDELVAGIDRIHAVACERTGVPASELAVLVGDVLRWLDRTLKPHMRWEEAWLFPQIDHRAGTPWATRLARFDHRQITERAARVATRRTELAHGPSSHEATELRGELFGLEALLRANLEREEEILLPALDGEPVSWSAEWRG